MDIFPIDQVGLLGRPRQLTHQTFNKAPQSPKAVSRRLLMSSADGELIFILNLICHIRMRCGARRHIRVQIREIQDTNLTSSHQISRMKLFTPFTILLFGALAAATPVADPSPQVNACHCIKDPSGSVICAGPGCPSG